MEKEPNKNPVIGNASFRICLRMQSFDIFIIFACSVGVTWCKSLQPKMYKKLCFKFFIRHDCKLLLGSLAEFNVKRIEKKNHSDQNRRGLGIHTNKN